MTSAFFAEHRITWYVRIQIITCVIVAQMILPIGVYAQSKRFVAIPPDAKTLYRFNFEKLFYPNEAARQKDLDDYRLLHRDFEALKSTATSSAENLLKVLELYQKLGILGERIRVYGGLRYSVNTNDTLLQNAETLHRAFSLVEKRLKEFETLVGKQGV